MSAKIISKISKILLAIICMVAFVLKWRGILVNATSSEIIACCFAAYGIVAGTIDVNISLDKIVDILKGGQYGNTRHTNTVTKDNRTIINESRQSSLTDE